MSNRYPMLVAHSDSASRLRELRGEAGWFSRVCRWVTRLAGSTAGAADIDEVSDGAAGPDHASRDRVPMPHAIAASAGNILSFPNTGRHLLTQLAHEIWADVMASPSSHAEPARFVVGGRVVPRLWIDATAYAEYCDRDRTYLVVLGEGLPTRISLETAAFDEVRKFIREYVLATEVRSSDGDHA